MLFSRVDFLVFAEALFFLICGTNGFSCYQCSNIPGNYSQPGCSDSSPNTSFVKECNWNLSSLVPPALLNYASTADWIGRSGKSMQVYPQLIQNMQMHQLAAQANINRTSLLGPKETAVESNEEFKWYCFKSVAELGSNKIVVRGCMPEFFSDLTDKCERQDYEYVLGDLTFKKSLICFCDVEQCNRSDKSAMISIVFLAVSVLASVLFRL